MKRFIGRKEELRSLDRLYQKSGFQMLVLYGRRRIGKTTLLNRFMEGKQGVFYTAVRTSARRNMEMFGKRLVESLAPESREMSFGNLEAEFSFLTRKSAQERIIVVIDEFPYWAEMDGCLTSVLQKYIDTEWMQGQMMLILSGSSLSFMENHVLGEKSPLFGRRTAQIRLGPFSYREAGEFVPAYGPEDKAVCYGVTGGIAKYLSLLDDCKSLDENLVDLFFSRDGYLFEEPSNLLAQEFRSVSSYGAIIEAVAGGAGKVNEIADHVHIDGSSVSHALSNLQSVGVVQKRFSITEETNKKKIRYTLGDGMFRFWYRYVPEGVDMIQAGLGEKYYRAAVLPYLSEYMGGIFEEMARSYTLTAGIEDQLGFVPLNVGQWWGTNPATRTTTDIDLVALNKYDRKAAIGECNYKNEILDKKILDELKERNQLLDHRYEIVRYLLFSKSGFSNWLEENAEKENTILISLDQMYQ